MNYFQFIEKYIKICFKCESSVNWNNKTKKYFCPYCNKIRKKEQIFTISKEDYENSFIKIKKYCRYCNKELFDAYPICSKCYLKIVNERLNKRNL